MAKSVKRFERSDGLDTALYKYYLFYLYSCALERSRQNATANLSAEPSLRAGNRVSGPRL